MYFESAVKSQESEELEETYDQAPSRGYSETVYDTQPEYPSDAYAEEEAPEESFIPESQVNAASEEYVRIAAYGTQSSDLQYYTAELRAQNDYARTVRSVEDQQEPQHLLGAPSQEKQVEEVVLEEEGPRPRAERPKRNITDAQVLAEIVIIHTNLSTYRTTFYNSIRCRHFLDCKGVLYYVVNVNREFSSAAGLADSELLNMWKSEEGLLIRNPLDADEGVLIPQVIVDGVSIGGMTALQDLEEDGDLDHVFSRHACPNCLADKDEAAIACGECGVQLKQVIPQELIADGRVLQVARGHPFGLEGEDLLQAQGLAIGRVA